MNALLQFDENSFVSMDSGSDRDNADSNGTDIFTFKAGNCLKKRTVMDF